MARNLTAVQYNNLVATATRPINLVRWEHSGMLELLSCSGDITFGGEMYSAGGVEVDSIEDGRTATLSLPATPARVAEVINGNWRNGKICKIFAVPGLPEDDGDYALSQGILVLDGVIDSSQYANGMITVNAIHRYLRGNLTPRTSFNELSTHIPPSGTMLTWEGESYMLVSRR
jgi:hypothetical protein